ncbi:gliding motility-associated C-terminal domain-containing protein, partial [Aureivirga sp. CE67]|uniref:DUF7507 domain-containing protein n=1 Tax=Aureivirga sp. CE67 TaxID=1788983 RepID=UPI0018CAC5C2
IKTVTSDVSNLAVGDVVTYTVLVSNTGNVTLDNVSIVDTLTELDGVTNPQTLASIFDSSSMGSLEGILQVGEVATYTVSYTVTQSDIDNGGFANSVFASGDSPEDTKVNDTSDDNDDTDGNTEDDPTEITISEDPSIEVVKTVTSDVSNLAVGDVVTYTVLVSNTGNVTLDNVSIVDTLTELDGTSNPQTLASVFDSSSMGSLEGILQVGEVATYTVSYTVTQSDIDNGGFANSVFASGDSPEDTTVEDVSDDNDDVDGNTEDDPTEVAISEDPSIEVVKTVTSDISNLAVGDVVTYTVLVSNTGNVTLDNVSIVDTLTELDGTSNPQTLASVFDSASMGSLEGILQVGEVATYTVSYTVTQSDIDNGGFANSVFASGDSPENTTVEDVSDDNDDADGNTEDDPTEITISEDPSIEAVKIVDEIIDNGDGILGAGDEIIYNISVTNTGNVTLSNVVLLDLFEDFNGNQSTLTTEFVDASQSSVEGTLQVGEIATYTVSYILTQEDVDSGGIKNSITATGESPNETEVSDVSDDGDDADGNTEDDETETVIPDSATQGNPSLDVEKTAEIQDNGDGELGVGDTIIYTITIENVGNVTLSNLELEDIFQNIDNELLTLTSGPSFTNASLGSSEGTIQVNEIVTYEATYVLTQEDVDVGGVKNIVIATADTPGGEEVSDISDDGDDTDGNTLDDPTELIIDALFEISILKEVNEETPVVENNVIFTITIMNEGDVTANNIEVSEILPSGYEFVNAETTLGEYSESSGVWTIEALPVNAVEFLEIEVKVLGDGDYENIAEIASYEGGLDANENNNIASATTEPLCLTIYNEFSPNGDQVNDTFIIDCIERYPNNRLEVYNRWGTKVYEKQGYLNEWDGTSKADATIKEDDGLPVGTYYYILNLNDGTEPIKGWLYINR